MPPEYTGWITQDGLRRRQWRSGADGILDCESQGGSGTSYAAHIAPLIDAVEGRISGGLTAMLNALRRCALDRAMPLYLVGGPVRDALLGLAVHDLDFVLEGDAPALAREVAAGLGGDLVSHQAFGTASVSLGPDRIDMVTARRETYPHPGALPQVYPGTIWDDLSRRDFSINAMAVRLGAEHEGLIDPHGGMADLEAGVVRALHPGSFVDDPTRIFRAARYEKRLGFRIETETLLWMKEAVASGGIQRLTPDRVRHEIEHILGERSPGPPLSRLAELGVLSRLAPGFSSLPAVERLTPAKGGATPMLYLAGLAYPLTPAQVEILIGRLNMPNSWARVARDAAALREIEEELAGPGISNSRVAHLLLGKSEDAIRAAALVSHSPAIAQLLEEFLVRLRLLFPKLDGNDMLALGVPPGPCVGRMLRELADAKLDGLVNTMEDERRFVREALVRGEDRHVG